ncbi:MAG: sterol desaturase family protein [Caulobacteraceae bacterium]|nr:sterol desaturase family protein [Caulobacteraceae bacterium]
MPLKPILLFTLILTVIIAVRYLAAAGAVYAWIWMRPPEKVSGRRLNRDPPRPKLVAQEIRLSLLSSWIYALPAVFVFEVWWLFGGTKIYLDVGQYGWPWFIASGFVYLAIQDAYYYWLHRLMHHRALFKWTHAAHHRSRQPTPFASFAFAWPEAALNAWLTPALMFVIPIHPIVLAGLLTVMTVSAVLNHCGWELLPDRLVRGPVGKWLISATHHNVHHLDFTKNYGLYFRVWDRLMGTESMPTVCPNDSRRLERA